MYEVLKQKKKLPKVDAEPLGIGYSCMVGVTEPLDPEMYPVLKDDFCHFSNVMGGARHSVSEKIRRWATRSRPPFFPSFDASSFLNFKNECLNIVVLFNFNLLLN